MTNIDGDVSGENVNIGGTQIIHQYFGGRPIHAPAPRSNKIFLSYARDDDDADFRDPAKSFLRRLYTSLKANNYDVWWDRESMPSRGLEFLPEIRRAIDECWRVILVVGPGAVKSEYVRAEWEHARERCIPVIPLLRKGEGTDADYEQIPEALRAYHTPDFRKDEQYDAQLGELLRVLTEKDAPTATLYGVPPLPAAYIERKEALGELTAKVRKDSDKPVVVESADRITTVYGVGGIGKSTLAAALAQECQIQRQFSDGVFWIEMGRTPQVATRMGDIGAMFNLPAEDFQDIQRAQTSLSRLLRDKYALIVLDDVWDHEHAEPFLAAIGTSRLVITTRQGAIATNLDVEGQRLAKLTDDEGVALIHKRLGVESGEEATLRQIVREVDGHTLAVSIAAAWLDEPGRGGLKAAGKLLERLKKGKLFEDLNLHARDKDRNLEISLSLSYDDLGGDIDEKTDEQKKAYKADLQRRFRVLGVFTTEGTFDEQAAAAVWGDADADDAERPLSQLERAGLLERVEGRYRRHGLLRTYARALLEREKEFDAVFARYAEWVIQEAEAFNILPLEEWATLDSLLPHVHEVGDVLAKQYENAGESASDALVDRVGRFAVKVSGYVYYRPQVVETAAGRVLRGMNWLEAGLVAFRRLGEQGRQALMLNQIALAWKALGEKRKALDYYEQALPLDQTLGDRSGEATTLNNIGAVWDDLGEKRKALDYYEQALPLYQAVGDRGGEAATLNNIGLAWDGLGEKRKALDYYEQALPLRQAVGDRRGEAVTLNNIGMVWDALGEKGKALDYYEQVLPLRRAVGDRVGEAVTLNSIGKVWSDLGEKEKALDYYEQALPLLQAVGDRGEEATTLNNMATVYFSEGDYPRVIELFNQVVAIFQAIGAVTKEAGTHGNIAVVQQTLGQLSEAIAHIEQGLALLQHYNLPQSAGGTTVEQFEAFLAQLKGERDGG